MRRTEPLNQLQLAILRWIGDGCPNDQVSGSSYKRTAQALRDRRLVEIDRRGGGWTATLTDTGRYYLEHEAYPISADERSTAANRRVTPTATTKPARRPKVGLEGRVSPVTGKDGVPATEQRQPRLSPTEKLVADVVAAGGRLEFEPDSREESYYELHDLVRKANRFGKAPPGKRLALDRVRRADDQLPWGSRCVLFFEDGPPGADAPLEPVPVPEEVRRYHPVVSALRKNRKLPWSAANTRRWRILNGLAAEAVRRGYTVTAHTPRPTPDHRSRPETWDLLLARDEEVVPLKLGEESDRVEHVPTARELAQQKRNPWVRIPSHDNVPSGRLRVDLGGPHGTERRSFWADRAKWSLEEKLPEVFREVAVRIEELQMKREAKIRAEAEYRQAVEQERIRARERAGESYRQEILAEQVERWREANELRSFAAAVAARIEGADEADADEIAAARKWLTWIDDKIKHLDPLVELPAWPAAPDLPSWKLGEFMKRVPRPFELNYLPPEY